MQGHLTTGTFNLLSKTIRSPHWAVRFSQNHRHRRCVLETFIQGIPRLRRSILAISSAHFGAERLLTLASLSSLQTRALYSAASPFLAFRDEPFKLIASFCCLSMYG